MKRTLPFILTLFLTCADVNSLFAQWVRVGDNETLSFTSLDTNLFAGTRGANVITRGSVRNTVAGGVYRSTDSGTSWTAVNTGLTTTDEDGATNVYALAVYETNLFAGTNDGVFRSTDNGQSWNKMSISVTNGNVSALAMEYNIILAGISDRVFSNDLYGIEDWTEGGSVGGSVTALVGPPDTLWVGSYGGGVFFSTNTGYNEHAMNTGLTDKRVTALVISGTNLFAGTLGGGVFLSPNNGTNWTAVDSGLTDLNVNTLAVAGTNIFVGTEFGGVFLSTNNGARWTALNTGFGTSYTPNYNVFSLAALGSNLFAGTWGGMWRRPLSEMITGVKQNEGVAPKTFLLCQNYPNPFNPSTIINYQIPTNALVVLKVFDVLGRDVQTLVNERQSAGSHFLRFNASNLPSGVYFYRLEAGTYHDTKKLLLLK